MRPQQMPTEDHEICEPDEVVWLRDLDGTGSMHVCTPHDPGAIKYIREDLVVATWKDAA